jgi:protein-disulfide isomerase
MWDMDFSRRSTFRLAGGALLGAVGLSTAVRAQSAANQWYPIDGDDGQPVPNQRAPVELTMELEELPGVIWGGGGPSPAVTLVEFFDYNCPWCRGAATELTNLMRANPDLRVGLVNNAILSPQSMQAAKVQLAVLQTKGAKATHDLHQDLFGGTGKIDGPRALDAAAKLGVDRAEIERVADSPATSALLRKQMTLAASLGLIATPSFVIGGAAVLGYPGPNTLARLVAETRRCGTLTC